MNPTKVSRDKLTALTDLPNIGKAGAEDLRLLGINEPSDLIGKCPYTMYELLCVKTAKHHDPCVIDVFISITRFMDGDEPKTWWTYTEERKRNLKQSKEDGFGRT